ncbi:MAG: hypothetical protein HUU41_08570 [Bryobacteraceae bacterium]|nr:hypothetical protein [Bryobacterales bacterium]MEB2360099.1 hypothetical protein [Bryobacterales bacterium]NUN01154.1 hypothetical protein [Bryobacteraceae bacterium]
MSLIGQTPSDRTRRAILCAPEFFRQGDPSPDVLLESRWGQQVFTLELQDIANGHGLGAAKPTSWRVLAGGETGPAVAASVTQPRSGAAPKMTSLGRGAKVERAFRAAQEIERLPEVLERDYELSVLSIPGLLMEAFWLKPAEGGPELIVPFLTLSRHLESMRRYSAEEFFRIVQPLAKKRLEFDDTQQQGH